MGILANGKIRFNRRIFWFVPIFVTCAFSAVRADIKVHPLYEPESLSAAQGWQEVPGGLHGSFGSTDRRYERNNAPEVKSTMNFAAAAWRGERVNAQIVLWTSDGAEQVRFSASPLKNEKNSELPADCVYVRFVRYVLADEPREDGCGPVPEKIAYRLAPDVLDTAERLDMPTQSVRPLWVTVDIPAGAEAGLYRGQINVQAKGGKSLVFELAVEVLPVTLPEPSAWSFHLDLWQNPFSVSQYHHVKPWSAEHYQLLEPVIKMLANAGQKCITASIVHQPWGGQTYEPFESMIKWMRHPDGSWSYDYTAFDKWVEFCISCGINKQINCYSMVPWGNRFRYLDKETGDYKTLELLAGTDEYQEHWRPFLQDFEKHLRMRGWLDRTTIAMDERPLEAMQKVIKFMNETAPELKITLAGDYHSEIKFDIYDYCVFLSPPPDKEFLTERTKRSMPTTFYVCCKPQKPNTFANSPPAESAWLGWHAAAKGYTGFLRWAYNSWVENPLYDTNYIKWVAGDCFLVYPGPRSSIRFERLREGIADFEKIRILRTRLTSDRNQKDEVLLKRLEAALAGFDYELMGKVPCEQTVSEAKTVLTEISKEVAYR